MSFQPPPLNQPHSQQGSSLRAPILVICGGFHPPHLSDNLTHALTTDPHIASWPTVVLPRVEQGAALSAHALRRRLQALVTDSYPIVILAFSAGGVGGVGLAHHWHRYGGGVRALVLVDGWGIPAAGPFPIYRLCHDYGAYRAETRLGPVTGGFWAAPGVAHRALWQYPAAARGWRVDRGPEGIPQAATPSTALAALGAWLAGTCP